MIFDHRLLADIRDDEIESLVENHVKEGEDLEYKLTINLSEDREKHEALRDIASLANSGGGYLIVGIRDDGKGGAQVFDSHDTKNFQSVMQSLQSLCLEKIQERIFDLNFETREIKGNPILIVRVPDSLQKPHMVSYNESTDFWKRYGAGKRAMTLSEIRYDIRSDITAKKIDDLIVEVRSLRKEAKDAREVEEISKILQSGEEVKISQIENSETIVDLHKMTVIRDAGSSRVFSIAIVPENPQRDFFSTSEESFVGMFRSPAGSRIQGWNMEFLSYGGGAHIQHGLRWNPTEVYCLEVLRNGFMSFRRLIDASFCWRQSDSEFEISPSFYPYPVIEYPASFIRLYSSLLPQGKVDGKSYLVHAMYENIKGCRLRPHSTSMSLLHNPPAFAGNSIYFRKRYASDQLSTDIIAYDIAREVYSAFGYDEGSIPWWDATNREFTFG